MAQLVGRHPLLHDVGPGVVVEVGPIDEPTVRPQARLERGTRGRVQHSGAADRHAGGLQELELLAKRVGGVVVEADDHPRLDADAPALQLVDAVEQIAGQVLPLLGLCERLLVGRLDADAGPCAAGAQVFPEPTGSAARGSRAAIPAIGGNSDRPLRREQCHAGVGLRSVARRATTASHRCSADAKRMLDGYLASITRRLPCGRFGWGPASPSMPRCRSAARLADRRSSR